MISSISELGDRRAIAFATGSIGSIHRIRGEYDQAVQCYEEQLAIATRIGDRSQMSSALGNIGNVCYARGRYDEALDYYQSQLSMHSRRGSAEALCWRVSNLRREILLRPVDV